MKYIKKSPIVRNNPMDDRFSVLYDDRIVTNSKVSMEVPSGNNATRPSIYANGQIRWNSDLAEFEVYNGNSPGLGWEVVRTVRPAPITLQNLGIGDYVKTDFGPLQWSTGEDYKNFTNPQNIFVFIENVFQIPLVNYSLIQVADKVYIRFTEAVPTKPVRVLMGYDGYFPPFPAP
jgi:hypothetical protein